MVREGDVLLVEKLDKNPGDEVVFEVLALSDDGGLTAGTPVVNGASVIGKVLEHTKGQKLIIFKKRRRKDSKVKRGHRQNYTKVEIIKIEAGGG